LKAKLTGDDAHQKLALAELLQRSSKTVYGNPAVQALEL